MSAGGLGPIVRARHVVASRLCAAILCVAASACGATSGAGQPAAGNAAAGHAGVGHVGAERAYVFEREQLRLRRSERNASTLAGTVTIPIPDGPGSRAVTLERARYTQGDFVVRELDPAAGDQPLSFTQVLDASGAAPLSTETRSVLGDELAQAMELIPVGSCGVMGLERDPQMILGFAENSGLPRAYSALCTRAAAARVGVVMLHCEASLDRELELSSEARARGMTASLRGRLTLDGELDVATGLCLVASHHLSLDVINRLGAYEEHDAAELDLHTSLEPR